MIHADTSNLTCKNVKKQAQLLSIQILETTHSTMLLDLTNMFVLMVSGKLLYTEQTLKDLHRLLELNLIMVHNKLFHKIQVKKNKFI
jgi:hypothetical protein